MGISPDRFRLYNKTGSACQAQEFPEGVATSGCRPCGTRSVSSPPRHLRAGLSKLRSFGAGVENGSPLGKWQRILFAIVVLACVVGVSFAQIAKKRPVSKGPRAVALIQLAENGRAHLFPVTIMINGDFYDASAYKADPVPMALQPGIVYEAVKAGVSQGLFTVGGAAQANGNWFADGKWVTAEQIEADKEKSEAAKKAQSEPKPDEEIGGPPKLKRAPGSGSPASSSPSSAPASSPAPTKADSSPPASESKPKPTSQETSTPLGVPDDPNRPVLRRQPLSATTHEQTKASPESEPLKGPLQFIAAVSDADGPEPRPYTFKLKPEEEQGFLKKMLAMAGDEVRVRSERMSATSAGDETVQASKQTRAPRSSRPKTPGKKLVPQPEFHQVDMKAFDIANSNEAVLVLTASANMPGGDAQYLIALVAREDIYGDLHKIFAHTTDSKHLDVLPRYDFIDAVDADGDGRGELLFRETWDSGSAFAVYRVIGDRLWPLFEGKPGS
jgi:hypothetical protein